MNKENIIGLVLIFGMLIAYSIWMTPSQEELAQKQRVQDSIAQVQQRQIDSMRMAAELESKKEPAPLILEDTPQDSDIDMTRLLDRFGGFAKSAIGEEKTFYLESEVLRLGISTKGGRIVSAELREFQTWDTLPLELINKESSAFGLVFFSNNRIINTENLFFEPYWYESQFEGSEVIRVSGDNELSFGMRAYANEIEAQAGSDRYLEFKYTLSGNNYMTSLDMNFVGLQNIIDQNTNFLELKWKNQLLRQEKNLKNARNASTIHYRYASEDMGSLSETKDDTESLKTRIKWIAFKQQFFTTTLIAQDNFISAELATFVQEDFPDDRYVKNMEADISIPYQPAPNYSIPLNLYMGPTKYNILRQYDLQLERQIPLGWGFFLFQVVNRYAVIPVFNFLEGFNFNYGIIILILTILLKIVLFPLTYKTYISQARMRVLKPEVEELNKKFPKKEDAMKKQQALMALYKKAGVNPMSGCVPMVIQLPILIALFRFFPSSIELRQQGFLWAHDLSTYDSVLDLPFTIPFYGDHVSLFTLLMALSTVAYTYVNSKMMDTGSTQMPGMKMMMYLMPVMFLGFFNNYSAGLSYYYMLTNLITFAQMFLIRSVIDENKIRAKIIENKKKPVKTSKFQKRLEEMAKQRGYKPGKK